MAPVIFFVAKHRKIIGVFAFLAPVHPHQNQFPATLWRGQPQNSLNDQQSITHTGNRQECDVATF
ncbi:TPA: replication protein RepA [Escherichia coli]|nr:replication protein RepA [Escherichia coli]QKA29600.1 replication protein RepA [Escherichia coli O157:H7]QRM87494.1 replication protein RepA [Escherichia coli O157:H-]EEV6388131.1 replication protein RepA [Escherichia coli]EEV6398171.1 replication protein RepA [Escherichia coli]